MVLLLADPARPPILDYAPLSLYLVLVVGMIAVLMLLPLLIAKTTRHPVKDEAYECGLPPQGSAKQRFSVHYYLVALLFILFDIEAVFLFPWAVSLQQIGFSGFVSALVFVAVLSLGLGYAWRKGVLDWK